MLTPSRTPPRLVTLLGYGGLIPFVGLTALAWIDPARQPRWSDALLDYGAIILAFVGALHWAFAMQAATLAQARLARAYAWSVVPALLGWMALQLPAAVTALLLAAGFVLHLWADRDLGRQIPLPAWYPPLRLRLTVIACACLLVQVWHSAS